MLKNLIFKFSNQTRNKETPRQILLPIILAKPAGGVRIGFYILPDMACKQALLLT